MHRSSMEKALKISLGLILVISLKNKEKSINERLFFWGTPLAIPIFNRDHKFPYW